MTFAPKSDDDTEKGTSFEYLSQRYREPLTHFFQRRIGSAAEAEDLTHDVFVRLLRRVSGEPIEDPEAFLFRTAMNLLRDRAKRRGTANRNATEVFDRHEKFEALSPERVLLGKELLKSAMEALDELDERSRDIFILNRVQGMKYGEIAQRYSLSVSSVEKIVVKVFAYVLRRRTDK